MGSNQSPSSPKRHVMSSCADPLTPSYRTVTALSRASCSTGMPPAHLFVPVPSRGLTSTAGCKVPRTIVLPLASRTLKRSSCMDHSQAYCSPSTRADRPPSSVITLIGIFLLRSLSYTEHVYPTGRVHRD